LVAQRLSGSATLSIPLYDHFVTTGVVPTRSVGSLHVRWEADDSGGADKPYARSARHSGMDRVKHAATKYSLFVARVRYGAEERVLCLAQIEPGVLHHYGHVHTKGR
jgi:hypothetical protein